MYEYIKKMMLNKVEEIRKSMTNNFPPQYKPDHSEYHNCYSHAFDIDMEFRSRDIYVPGMISMCAQKTEIDVIEKPFLEVYKMEKILKSIISDADVLGRNALITNHDTLCTLDSYKIFLCEDEETGLWHFARESVTTEGQRILTHKESYRSPTSILIRKGNKLYTCCNNKYNILSTLELSPKKNN